jgi:hypothetical protein
VVDSSPFFCYDSLRKDIIMTNRIGLLGDTHGNANVVLNALKRFFVEDVTDIVQVGDFGFWPGKHGATFLTYVNNLLAKNGQTIYVVPGNHEDYTYLRTLNVREDGWAEAKSHILVAPRGHRWEWEGRTFVALGGAPSVDRAYRLRMMRTQGQPVWWKEEAITREDMDKTMEGGYADIMIAHDAPYGVRQIENYIAGNPNGFEEEDLAYALQGRQDMAEVVDVVRPILFFHGHYHKRISDKILQFNENTGMDDTTRILGLASDGAPSSQGILDLETLEFDFWHGDAWS